MITVWWYTVVRFKKLRPENVSFLLCFVLIDKNWATDIKLDNCYQSIDLCKNGWHLNILLFTLKLVLLTLFKVKYSFDFFVRIRLVGLI